ncbi:intein-containing RctB family protein, partial [Elusimicrobiota bacterium]
KKINDWRWEVLKTGGMRVPGMIYASEAMIGKIRSDNAAQQVANVAHLPGIVGHSLAMPDCHWGYGACIGGVAAVDIKEGVISPGGIGYDISCLSGNTEILFDFGYTKPIAQVRTDIGKKIRMMDLNTGRCAQANISHFMEIIPRVSVFKVVTMTGKSIIATEDHPFYTLDGMKELKDLEVGRQVAIRPFIGVPFENPDNSVIVDEKKITDTCKNLGRSDWATKIVIKKLKQRGLLPLSCDNPSVPFILKLMGFLFGDGTIGFRGRKKEGVLYFFSKHREDLKEVREDLGKIGYRSAIFTRQTRLCYKGRTNFFTNHSICCSASSLVILMAALGVPIGAKVNQPYEVPSFVRHAPLWHKRLFLSALFGAELTVPQPRRKVGCFHAPVFTMNKSERLAENAKKFLEQIARMAGEFGILVTAVNQRRPYRVSSGRKHWMLELIFSSKTESLLNLWSRVGFSYSCKRRASSGLASHYMALKRQVLRERRDIVSVVRNLITGGRSAYGVARQLQGGRVGPRFIQDVARRPKTQNFEIRLPRNFIDYEAFAKESTAGLSEPDIFWDRIVSKERIDWSNPVYDLTIDHPDHNFIANTFVVSNCGIRLIRSDIQAQDMKPRMQKLVDSMFHNVPSGVGSTGKIHLKTGEMKKVFVRGANWAIENGYGWPEDRGSLEDGGVLEDADPDIPSKRSVERGKNQLGTLGSGNHFMEIQAVDEIYDEKVAQAFGLFKGQLTIMIHTGSRGCGYQICDDFLQMMVRAAQKYNISLPDRQLCCAPLNSQEGRDYFGAMCSAANFARANRQVITHWIRQGFEKVLGQSDREMGLGVVYDVCHNIAKIEEHDVDGKKRKLCVHRKGATRAFPAGHPQVPHKYIEVGQPVLIPGSMGTSSYVLVGTQTAMKETFGTACHGAGRVMSRTQASKRTHGAQLIKELEGNGILVRTDSYRGLAEEAPFAYKDVSQVVQACEGSGISKKVARMRPLAVVKG